MLKYCNKCKKEKDISCFTMYNGIYRSYCKECVKQYNIEYRKKNKKELIIKKQKYYLENKEEIKEKVSIYQKTKNGKKVKNRSSKKYRKTLKAKETRKKWINNNRERLNKLKRIRYEKNKLNHNISQAIRDSLRYGKNGRHWEDLVGFTLNDLKNHLENQFEEGMCWDNYGRFGWHIDHIIPIASFDITDYNCEDFKKCWSLDNLQPLWAEENLSKGSKIL